MIRRPQTVVRDPAKAPWPLPPPQSSVQVSQGCTPDEATQPEHIFSCFPAEMGFLSCTFIEDGHIHLLFKGRFSNKLDWCVSI